MGIKKQEITQTSEHVVLLETNIDTEYDMPDYAVKRMATFFFKKLRENPPEEILGK